MSETILDILAEENVTPNARVTSVCSHPARCLLL